MILRSFTISTTGDNGPRRWWWVRIHDTLPALRAAAMAYSSTEQFSDCYACVQVKRWCDPAGRYWYPDSGYCGVMRFAAGHIGGEIAAHELLHAALAIYRIDVDPDAQLGPDICEAEEQLAYLFGELYASFEHQFTHPLAGASTSG